MKIKKADENIIRNNYNNFIKELTILSKKYGVVVQSTGGVMIGKVEQIEYGTDYTSGDLEIKKLAII